VAETQARRPAPHARGNMPRRDLAWSNWACRPVLRHRPASLWPARLARTRRTERRVYPDAPDVRYWAVYAWANHL